MQFTVGQLLENFSEDSLVDADTIVQRLGIQDIPQALRQLQVALDALEKIGILFKDGGQYRRLPDEGLVPARLRCSSKGFCFAIQDGEGTEDVYIHESRLNGAWNGDRVLVRVTKDGVRRRSPEGEVRLITERVTPTLLARVKAVETGYRAVPLDDRLLFEVELVAGEEVPDLAVAEDHLTHVEVVRYPLGSHLPLGKILQILGKSPETTNDIDLICCKYNLPRRFGVKEMSEAASTPRSVRKADLKHRLDLRELVTLRLGSAPALSLEVLETGWRLGVHIPDVAHYVSPESAMSATAQKRGRSFHLGETVLPMLPEIGVLSQPEHLTMSLLVQIDGVGNIIGYEIQPSVVALRSSLSYRRAQAILEQADGTEPDDLSINQPIDAEVQSLLESLVQVARLLPQVPFQAVLPQAELSQPDEGMWGVPVLPEDMPIAGVVSNLCVLANRLIAEHLQALHLPLLRVVQSPPDANKLGDWLKLVASISRRELEGAEAYSADGLAGLVGSLDEQHQPTLAYLLARLWRLGEYSLGEGGHFGVGTAVYTHAVLPQFRYGDLLVQRLLHASFEAVRDRRSSRSREGLNFHSSSCHGLVQGCVLSAEAEKHWQEVLAQAVPLLNQQNSLHYRVITDLEGLRKAEVMRTQIGANFYGLITGVQSYGFFVEIEGLLVEGLVHVSSLKDDWYEFPANGKGSRGRYHNVLVGRRSGRQFGLGDRVEVQVKGVDYYRQQIDLGAVIGETVAEEVAPEPMDGDADPDISLPENLRAEFAPDFSDPE
jgi:ribonuclease R